MTEQSLTHLQRTGLALARRLVSTPVTPNQITLLSMALGLAGAAAFADGSYAAVVLGALLFSLARGLDHVDGALARLSGQKSRLGYYLDYCAGGISYTALFIGMGYGLSSGYLGNLAIALGLLGGLVAIVSVFLNLDVDRLNFGGAPESAGYPQFAGIAIEDGVHLIVPVTLLGLHAPFFVAAAVSAGIYGCWTFSRVIYLRRVRERRSQ